MARLTETQKLAVVRYLAEFRTPADVVVLMKEEFGVSLDRFQVRTYDPTSNRYEAGERWRIEFEARREAVLREQSTVPISHKAYRLWMLQRLFDRASQTGNIRLAMSILDQAAREAGGRLTNESRLEIEHRGSPYAEWTPEERRQEVRRLLDAAMSFERSAA